jgi:acetylglutamate synthase
MDQDKLRVLIESGFGRKLTPDYFRKTKLFRAYVSEHYRAALLLTKEDGVAHLDKFAVADDAQGEGLGRAAWLRMRADNPRLFWRSRPGNPGQRLLLRGMRRLHQGREVNVFWYGPRRLRRDPARRGALPRASGDVERLMKRKPENVRRNTPDSTAQRILRLPSSAFRLPLRGIANHR